MIRDDRFRDLDEIGDAIRELVEDAVRSQDFRQLSQNINKTVNAGGNIVRQAVRSAQQATVSYTDKKPNKNIYSSKIGSVPTDRKEEAPLPVLYRATGGKLAGGIVQIVGGGVLIAASGVSLLVAALVNSVLAAGSFLTVATATMFAGIGGGAFLLHRGIHSVNRVNRFQKYVRRIGQKTYCKLSYLAQSVGRPVKYVRKDLVKMIEDGYFLEGHLDPEGNGLITSDAAYQQFREARLLMQEQQAKPVLPVQQTEKADPQVQSVLDKGNAYIRKIRSCNDRIPGQEISDKIYRMEQIVQRIFDRAKAHPEIIPDLKKMMDYYLPMTVKLLEAYAEMDAQPIQGETIESSKREIEETLDTLNQAFEKLLDSFFKDTAMDVSSDISVLQTLLAQEGLTEDELTNLRRNHS